MAENYKIELGIGLNDKQLATLKQTINNLVEKERKIDIGVDFDIKNVNKLVEAGKQVEEIKKQLSSSTKGKTSVPIDTKSLDSSLKKTHEVIKNIRKSIGAIDSKKGVQSLLTSINHISSELKEVTNQFKVLNGTLTSLSSKDFNINLGLNFGGTNAKNTDQLRSELKQLQSAAGEYERYIQGLYTTDKYDAKKDDPFISIRRLINETKNANGMGGKLLQLQTIMADNGTSDQKIRAKIEAYKQYIALIKEAASIAGKPLASVEQRLVESGDFTNLKQEAKDAKQELKGLLGSIDAESLSASLKPIVDDLDEIKRILQELSQNKSLSGLTQSFEKLSITLKEVFDNYSLVKKSLDNVTGGLGSSNNITNTGLEKVENDLKQVTSTAENTAKAMQYVKETLSDKNVSPTNIDKVVTDLKNLGIEISNVTTRTTKNGINISVKGIDDLGRAVTVVRQFDKDFKGETIAKSFDTSADATKRWKKEVSDAYQDAKKVTQQIGSLEVELIGAKAKNDVKEIDRINNRLDALRKKLSDIKGVYGDSFTTRHNNLLKGLEDDIADKKSKAQNNVDNKAELQSITTNFEKLKSLAKDISNLRIDILQTDDTSDISNAKTELDKLNKEYDELFVKTKGSLDGKQLSQLNNLVDQGDAKILKEFNNELNEFVKLQNQIENTRFEIGKLEVTGGKDNEIETLKRQLEELEDTYNRLMNTFMKKAVANGDFIKIDDFKGLENGIAEATKNAENRLERFKSQWADTRAELAKNIKLDIELGNFDNQISQMDDKFNRLSNASTELRDSVTEVKNAYKAMEDALESTGDEVADRERLIQAEERYARALEKTNNLIRIQAREDKVDNDRLKLEDDRQVFQSKIDAWLIKNSAATKKFGASMLDLKAKAENCDRVTLNHLEKEFKKVDNAADKAGLKMQSTLDRVKGKFKEYMAYFSVAEVFMYVEQGLREMFNTVKEIDTAMTGLYRVTDLTASQYDALFNNMISSAKEYGATLNDIINATTDWVRAGFDADTALGLAEVTTMYQHISDLDYDTAAENLITAYNGFKDELNGLYDGDEVAAVRYIADIFNELDNNFAVTSAGLGEALTRSASALDLAGNSIQETAALVTGITEVTQDPEKAGSALKILSLRLRGMKGALEELGEETDENVENISKMQGQILRLTKGKVNIFDGAGEFKSTYEIMQGIAQIWDDLNSKDQADLLETIAGKHRANDIAALFSNWKNVEEAVKSATKAEGSAAAENAKYVDSIQGRLDKLTTTWQSFANTFMESDFLKGAISGLTTLVEIIEKLVKHLGTLGTIGLGAGIFGLIKSGGLTTFFKTFSILSPLISDADTLGGKIKNLGTVIGDAGNAAKKSISGFTGWSTAIGLVVTALGLLYNAYKKNEEEQAALRQETIDSANEFLDAADSFELAYIKYSGKTSLTAEEEADLESAIKGTTEALGDKSSALKDVVSGSNDYVASLERIQKAELEQAKKDNEDKQRAAKNALKDTVSNLPAKLLNSSNLDVIVSGDAKKIAEEMDSSFYDKKIIGGKIPKYAFSLDPDADVDETISFYNDLIEFRDILENAKLDNSSTYKATIRVIDELKGNVNSYIEATQGLEKVNYQLDFGTPKTAEEYLKMRKEILGKTKNFENKKELANILDEHYGSVFDLSSVEFQARQFDKIIKAYGGGGKDGTNDIGTVETFLNMRTAVNNNECTIGQYMDAFNDVKALEKDYSKEEKEYFETSLGIDTDSIKEQYDDIIKTFKRDVGWNSSYDADLQYLRSGVLPSNVVLPREVEKLFEFEEYLNSLTLTELQAVANIKTEIDWENDSLDSIHKQIEEEAKLIEAISFTVDLDIETEKLENLSSAVSESFSGAGLGKESMSLVEDMFGDLDNYDPSLLFERTSTGMRLNREELKKLNDEYKDTNIDGLENKMSALGDRYIQTRDELSELTYGSEEYKEKARDLSDIEAEINATETLISQYKGLTNAYSEWQRVESSGQERDMYESVIEGFENVGDEIARGWIDDGSIEFLELLTGKTDLASKSAQELKQEWKDLDKKINGKYSVRDFFTIDEDGNSTSDGVYNFLETVEAETEKFNGKDIIKRKDGKKDGEIIEFDFQVVGGNEAIAEALGISEELVDIMVRAADDAGFVVSMDGTYQQLDVLKKKAQEAATALKDTFKKTEFEFDLYTSDESSIEKQYQEALKIWEPFTKNKKADGTIDMTVKGAEEAYTLVSTLQSMIDKLSEPVYMELNATQVEKDMKTPLSKLQEYERLVQAEHQLRLKGTDTSELETDKEEIINYFDELQEKSPEIAAELGIKDLTREEIQAKVEAGEIEIPATIDLQVEMNNTLRDMVNIALYNAGLLGEGEEGKAELEKRVDISLYADKVDTSDVEEKTEDAVEGEKGKKSVIERVVEVTHLPIMSNSVSNLANIIGEYTETEQEIVFKFLADPSDVENYSAEDKEAIVKFIADSIDVDGYTPEEKEAYAKYLVDGGNIDAYTPEEKEAIAKYLADTGEPDSYTPEEKTAIAKFLKDSGEVDSYTPAQKQAIAKFIRDSLDVDNYQMPTNKWAYAKYLKDTYDIDIWTPPLKTGGIAEYTPSIIDTTPPTLYGGTAWYNALIQGDSPVNGTANVNGTAFANGTAFKQGNWGTKGSGVALMGELGTETIVRDGRFFTVGDDGAGFYRYKKGDIIFNHKQTEELFKNGKVTSDGGRARAYVSGTAFSKGTGGGIKSDVPSFTIGYDYNASKSDSDSKKSQEIFDWIKVAIERIEREIDNLDRTANNVYKSWSSRNSALASEINKVGNEIALQEKAYQGYMNAANQVGLSSEWKKRVQSGAIDIDNITDETLAEKIKDYQKYYEQALECKDAVEELKETEASLYKQRFDNVQAQYDGILQGYEHTETMLNEYISQAEAKGYIVSEKYYDALITNEKQNINKLKDEQAALIAARDKAVDEGKIIKGSQAWVDMCNEIDSVTQAIEEGNTALIEYNNSIRDIEWEKFDLIQERISDITAEANFLIELMSNKKLFNDDGKLTEQGSSTMGLHGQNYNTYMYQADDYGKEVAKLDKQIAKDPYDKELINRRRELIELQRESILNAEQEKNAIKDLVEEGINLELDALQEKIDLHNEELDSMKNLYEYQENVKEQTTEIASLQKQLSAYSGDNSEEAQKKVQELKVSLEEAEKDLQETEWDRYIDQQSQLLDSLYTEYETILNSRLDNIDFLLEQVIDGINAAAGTDGTLTSALGVEGAIAQAIVNAMGENGTMKGILNTEATKVGTTLSNAMNNIWSVGEGNAKSVLTEYGKGFQSKQTTTNTVLGNIKADVAAMVDDIDKDAKKKVEAPKTQSSAKVTPIKNAGKNVITQANNNNKKDSKANITEDTLMGVAASIWNYQKENYGGWGANPTREKRLTDKLGAENAKKVQSYINAYGANGKLYNFWISKNKNLDKYKYNAFKSGAKNISKSQYAWTQEDGQELIVRPSDGAILTPVAKRDSVLNTQASENLWNMTNSPAEFIKDNLNFNTSNVPNNSNVQSNLTQHFENITFNMPNVKNYEQLISEMQRDKNFENLILSMTVNQIAGKSKLAKGKAIR